MLSPFFGEFMGTMVLMLLGNGVNAGVSLTRSKAEGGNWLLITVGWAMAVFCGIVTAVACGSPGAHLNPAVTVAVAISTGNYSHVPSFIVAQMLGGIAGAALVWIFYMPHWELTEDKATKLGVFCTSPAVRKPIWNLVSEIIATSAFLLTIGAIGSKTFAAAGPAPGLAPYLVAMVVWSIGMSLGGTTGYAINPARDLGPRIAHAILPIAGKGDSDWDYAYVPVLGPIIGAILIGIFLRVTGI
jgi:glycerol uptake facilitator protein